MIDRALIPEHVPPDLVQPFDFDWHGRLEDMYPRWDALRERGRVLWLQTQLPGPPGGSYGEGLPGAWLLTQSDDIRAALQAPDLFSSEVEMDEGSPQMIPIFMDPPEHGSYRRLLTPLFAPQVVGKMEDSIRSRFRDLVDGLVARGRCDYVRDVAVQFPTRVFTTWLGLPEPETDRFVALVWSLVHGKREDRHQALGVAVDVLDQLVRDRVVEPRDDLMSSIAAQELDGRPLSHDELLGIAYLLFLAGLDSVPMALSFSFWHLAQSPFDRRSIADGTVSSAQAVEELLRCHSFVHLPRRVTRDVEFAGVTMKEDDAIVLSLPMASRDPREYDGATSVHLDRTVNRHYAFSAGPHRCLGSHLARLEMRIALEEWHARIPEYEIDGEVPCYSGPIMGMSSLPLRWGREGEQA